MCCGPFCVSGIFGIAVVRPERESCEKSAGVDTSLNGPHADAWRLGTVEAKATGRVVSSWLSAGRRPIVTASRVVGRECPRTRLKLSSALVVATKPEQQLRDGVFGFASAANRAFSAAFAGFADVTGDVESSVLARTVAFRTLPGLLTPQAFAASHKT